MKEMNLREHISVLETREPLSYGEETVGIKMLVKRINIYSPEQEKILAIPVILGNALRGILRDIMAEIFLNEVLKHVSEKPPEWHAGALLTLFSGGLLKGEERVERVTAADVAKKVADLLEKLIPLSIMGCALPGVMIPSKVKISIFYPVCNETYPLIEDLIDKIGDETLKLKLNSAKNISIEDLIMDVPMMRKDDTLKIMQLMGTKDVKVTGFEKALPEGAEKTREPRAPVQMLFYRQALAPGTLLIGKINELIPLRQEELGLLLLSFERFKAVGGAIARGFGEIIAYNLPEPCRDVKKAFSDFVGEHIAEISQYLSESPDEWLKSD